MEEGFLSSKYGPSGTPLRYLLVLYNIASGLV
jgi:hypothetical protein